mmetsp:Transcript_8146/g.20883  ORF Transcript_8146/g.20883 Transcript_8146/m.20883 type:complete len:252 (+) Transcript_8146:30-785(+)
MPLLHPGALDLLDVVAVHDVEDLVADLLAIAAAAQHAHHEAHPLLRLARGVGVRFGDGAGEAVLRRGEDAWLRVVVALPGDVAVAAVAQAHVDVRRGVRGVHLLTPLPVEHALQQVRALVVAVHEGPHRGRLRLDDLQAHRVVNKVLLDALHHHSPAAGHADVEVAVSVLPPARGVVGAQHKLQADEAVVGRQRDTHALQRHGGAADLDVALVVLAVQERCLRRDAVLDVGAALREQVLAGLDPVVAALNL